MIYLLIYSYPQEYIGPKQITGHDFPQNALKIRYSISCTELCNIYVLNNENVKKFRANEPFNAINTQLNQFRTTYLLENTTQISEKLSVYVLNPSNSVSLTTTFTLEHFIPIEGSRYTTTIVLLSLFGFFTIISCFIIIAVIIFVNRTKERPEELQNLVEK